jgi:MscS family membrane protein
MQELARKLQAVMDRRVTLEREQLDKISDLPSGNPADGMADEDEVGRVDMPLGSEPIRLHRRRSPDGTALWVFSLDTVNRIESWYERLEDRWALDHLPNALLITGPGGLLLWQWMMLPVLGGVAIVLGLFLARLLRIALRLAWRSELGGAIAERQLGPLRVLSGALLLRLLTQILYLTSGAEENVRAACNVGLIVGFMFGLWRVAEVISGRIQQSEWLRARPTMVGVMPLLHRLTEVGIWAAAVLWCLSELGYSVTGVLASLGLGGLAVALAAKNTLEHLLGGMTLSLDQPMRVGDLVRIGDVQGTVEQIGLRSTRIRTADRSLVTLPNGKLSDMQIETLAARDRIRMSLSLNVQYTLKAQGLRELREALLACIQKHPLIHKDKIRVHYSNLSDSAATIDITCWIDTSDQDQFLETRHSLLLQLIEVVESFGAAAVFKLAAPGK